MRFKKCDILIKLAYDVILKLKFFFFIFLLKLQDHWIAPEMDEDHYDGGDESDEDLYDGVSPPELIDDWIVLFHQASDHTDTNPASLEEAVEGLIEEMKELVNIEAIKFAITHIEGVILRLDELLAEQRGKSQEKYNWFANMRSRIMDALDKLVGTKDLLSINASR